MADVALITGGAGFIGSHVARELLACGYEVKVLDDLIPQVHGRVERPAYLEDEVELVQGDLRDPSAVRRGLAGADVVLHLAARVGVGQSMYEIAEYTSVNTFGTGVLLEGMLEHRVRRLIVASSMSIYGEGLYATADGTIVPALERTRARLEQGDWEPQGLSGEELHPVPTPEEKTASLSSVYALTKYDQERMCLLFGQSYGIPTVALRFFNAYGRDQALSNPYTGVLAIFAARLLNDRPPLIYEDGNQRRDFVSVVDAARACRLALETDEVSNAVLNIGSGLDVSVREVAARLGRVLGKENVVPEVTGKYRVGDVRHCFADVTRAKEQIGYEPQIDLDTGIEEMAEWLVDQAVVDRVESATAELVRRGLTI